MEQTAHFGGRLLVDDMMIDGKPAKKWVRDTLARLKTMPNVTIRKRMMGAGVYDHGYLLGYERLATTHPIRPPRVKDPVRDCGGFARNRSWWRAVRWNVRSALQGMICPG